MKIKKKANKKPGINLIIVGAILVFVTSALSVMSAMNIFNLGIISYALNILGILFIIIGFFRLKNKKN